MRGYPEETTPLSKSTGRGATLDTILDASARSLGDTPGRFGALATPAPHREAAQAKRYRRSR